MPAQPGSGLCKAAVVDRKVEEIVPRRCAGACLRVRRAQREEREFRQRSGGRPGPEAPYRPIRYRRLDIESILARDSIDYDRESKGIHRVLSSDRWLPPPAMLEAH